MACLASHMGCPAAVNEFYLRETGLLAGGIPKEEAADIDFTAPAPKVEDVDDVLVYRAVGSSRYEPPIIAPPAALPPAGDEIEAPCDDASAAAAHERKVSAVADRHRSISLLSRRLAELIPGTKAWEEEHHKVKTAGSTTTNTKHRVGDDDWPPYV
eukprot:jgi/Chrzof1/15211/Cz09g31230.t1